MHVPGNSRLSVIIPTLNEAENLPALLEDLKQQENINLEIIVGDGGSTDATRLIAESYGVTFVSSKQGRGAQMNAASHKASGDYFLFLHADSRIEDVNLFSNALQALTAAQLEQSLIAGHFRLRFIRSTLHNAMAYRYAEEKTAFNRVNTTNGDQGLMLSREFFKRLGGFDESMSFLEDQRIAEKIRSQGTWITLPGFLKTSARRFEAEGFHRRYTLMSIMMGLYSVGELDFFVRAPGIYQVQQNTGTLYLSPFFGLIWRMMYDDWGIWGSARIFYMLGRYIRQNSWQMFFFFDVLLHHLIGEARYPFLCLHDRVIAPCTNFKVFNALVGIFCFIWFMGILAPFYAVIDFRGQRYNAV
jgi:rSAM/selenodomain-associated transferase 2